MECLYFSLQVKFYRLCMTLLPMLGFSYCGHHSLIEGMVKSVCIGVLFGNYCPKVSNRLQNFA